MSTFLLRSVVSITALLAASAAFSSSVGCNTGEEDDIEDDDSAITAGPVGELPWELVSEQGETVVPNIFYAEDSQTEQVMPLAIKGHVMINRMIYPTIGNPKLYDKSDAADSAMVALRLEDALIAHLHPKLGGDESGLSGVTLDSSDADGVRVMLVSRAARERATQSTKAVKAGDGVVVLTPAKILKNPNPADMPAVLSRRSTYRFLFHKEQMASVPAGLYDVRVEVRKGGALTQAAGDREPAYEFQYNAIRVFDTTTDEYPIVSVTDTQISEGLAFSRNTETKFQEFVKFVNATDMDDVKKAAFVVFNGDLHQAGAPAGLSRSFVAPNYANEMTFAIEQLKQLPLPIHMVPGNHDGYASTGHAPLDVDRVGFLSIFNKSLKTVIADNTKTTPGTWPGFAFDAYDGWLSESGDKKALGGYARDIYAGSFARTVGKTFASGWKEVPRDQRNYILYDGQYQWERTIGPLNHSWKFRKSRYIGLNTYELRQHMRMSWGMYATNYGGSISDVQLDWFDRELTRADQGKDDVVLVAHHDPRGGKGHAEYGTYHTQLGFDGIYTALLDGVSRYSGFFTPTCKAPTASEERGAPAAADVEEESDHSCEREGKQIWMAADPMYDCAASAKKSDGTCSGGALFDSGPKLLERISRSSAARTFLIAHTHRNSFEMLQKADSLIPNRIKAGHELLSIELGSCAKITSMKFQGDTMYGFQLLNVSAKNDARSYGLPQINEIKYLKNQGGGAFEVVVTMPVDRTVSLLRDNPANPVNSVFKD